MNKKRIIIGTIVILGLSVIFHGVYEKFPNFFTSLLFPVNESIWEHNKMILLSFLVWSILEKIFTKSGKSILFLNFASSIICIVLINIVFTLVFIYILKFKDNLPVTIIIYTISIIISLIAGKKFLFENNGMLEIMALGGYLIVFIAFAYLTYHPLHLEIFYDYKENTYGIPIQKK